MPLIQVIEYIFIFNVFEDSFYFSSPVCLFHIFVKMKFLSIMDECRSGDAARFGDSIAFIFKHTYTATRIIINQLSIKCTRTRTITFPQLYNIRSNWKEGGDEFLLPQKPLRTTRLLLLLPSLSIHPSLTSTQMWSTRRKELSMQVSLQAHPSEVEMITLHTLTQQQNQSLWPTQNQNQN